MILYCFTYDFHGTLKSFTLFIIAKTITELNLGYSDKFEINIKTLLSWFTLSMDRRIWSFHVVLLQSTAKKCTKNYNASVWP